MRSPVVRGALLLLAVGIVAAAVLLVVFRPPELPEVRARGQAAGMPDPVPWREPERDRSRFFPGANAHREERRILSGERLTLIRRLGRQPTGEEHLVVFHRVLRGQQPLGVVMVRRVKGSGGSIEVVLAVGTDGRVRAVRVQRHREPAAAAAVLESPVWLGSFAGKDAAGLAVEGQGGAVTEGPARDTARAVTTAVRDALIVLELAEQRGLPATEGHH